MKFKLLLWKNFKTLSREKMSTLTEILAPLSIVLAFVIVRIIIKVETTDSPTIYESFSVSSIPDTVKSQASMILYSPKNPITDEIMLNFIEDYIDGPGLNYTVFGYDNKEEMIVAYDQERQKDSRPFSRGPVLAGISFDNVGSKRLPLNIKYTLKFVCFSRTPYEGFTDRINLKPAWFTDLPYPILKYLGPRSRKNSYGGFPGYYEEGFLYVQQGLDKSIARMLLNETQLEELKRIELKLQRFPFPAYSHDHSPLVSLIWIPYMYGVGFVFSVINLTRLMIREKVLRLKEFMKLMGLPNWMHWMTWFIRSFVLMVVISIFATILLTAEFKKHQAVYINSDPSVIFLVILLHATSTIAFSFLFSTLFSSEDAGATIAGFVWMVTVFPYFSFYQKYSFTSRGNRILQAAIAPNVAVSYIFFMVGALEADGVGLQWDNLNQGITPDDNFCVGDNLLVILGLSVAYFVAAMYIELVFPGRYGVKLPWYYPFTLWFWLDRTRNPKITKPVMPKSYQKDAFEADPKDGNVGVEFRGLSKIFGSRVAVYGLNFKMYQDQVTALLGHNGAGKTTTMSILTGIIRPSSGTAIVNGFDISRDMPSVRSSLGLCPQYNILFDNLTVEEHLRFYCKLKGLNDCEALEEIERCLGILGLEDKRHTQSKNLSGGMKRKLCVCIAFSAGSKVVLLDEPTAGMDPGARRSTWDLIQQEKAGKTVILSTHYMEEADLLGDRIAIMADGQLQCCGSSLFLKAKYGGSYNLTVVKKEAANVDAIKDVVLRTIPNVNFKDVGAEMSCTLPVDKITVFPPIFEELEARKDELGIGTYGVGSTTMEEIFIRVGETSKKQKVPTISSTVPTSSAYSVESLFTRADSLSHLYSGSRTTDRPLRHDGRRLWWVQFKAMIIKKFLVNYRRWDVACLQILVPAGMTWFMLYICKTFPAFDNPKNLLVSFEDFEKTEPTTVLFSCQEHSTLCSSFKSYMNFSRNVLDVEDTTLSSYLLEQSQGSKTMLNHKYILALEEPEFDSKTNSTATGLTALFNNQPHHVPPLALNILSNGLLKYFGLKQTIVVNNHPFNLHPMDAVFSQETWTAPFFTGYVCVFASSFLFASFTILPVSEQLSKSKHLQEIAGIRLPLYWLADFCVSFGVLLLAALVQLIVVVLEVDDGFQNFGMQCRYMALYSIFGLAVLPFVMFLSKYMKSASSAYARVLAISLTFGVLMVFCTSLLTCPEFDMVDAYLPAKNTFMAFPGFSLSTGISQIAYMKDLKEGCSSFDLNSLCATIPQGRCCRLMHSYFSWEPLGVGRQVVYLISFGLLFLVLLVISESGIIPKTFARIEKSQLKKRRFRKNFDVNGENGIELQDMDVTQENRRIMHATIASLSLTETLVIKGLTKVYKGKFTAVDRINVGVKRGEIFGLLGINGAGKTSTFKMLTGDTSITSGDAFINSHSIKNNPRKAHSFLGYCPQFDACIEELTGRETLTMFGRIKGIPERCIRELIDKVSGNLLFRKFLDKQIGTYSGGNKRKLSTALAMLGDPAVIFLDEPTAGMDPVARRHVWDAISLVREGGTSVVITSHNMEECEALCSNLAIMVRGKFKCIGPPQHLKSKLSPGYKLVAQIPYGRKNDHCTSDDEDHECNDWASRLLEFNMFLEDRFEGCKLRDAHPGFVQYTIPSTVPWSQIFTAMEEAKPKFLLEAYSVGQTDLEQVFFNFTHE